MENQHKINIKYIKIIFLTLLIFSVNRVGFSQNVAIGVNRVSGTVLDSLTNQPVAYATVFLASIPPNSRIISSVAADELGSFTFNKVPLGKYIVKSIYLSLKSNAIPITVQNADLSVGVLRMNTSPEALKEVVVVGHKPVVEVFPDKLVYNADQDISNSGGSAQDVMRKVPLLNVDGEGNVQLRGSANFKVLLNNKPSPIFARNLTDALKSFPADQIQSVEVITTPSAKYDGEGTAGVINIILKKGVEQSINGRLNATSGNRNTSLNSSINFRKKNINFTSFISSSLTYSPGRNKSARTGFSMSGVDSLNQSSDIYNKSKAYYGGFGIDYDINKYNSISTAVSVNGYENTSSNNFINNYIAVNPHDIKRFARLTTSTSGGFNIEATGTYLHTFTQPKRELSFLAQYATSTGYNGYDFSQYNNTLMLPNARSADYLERSLGKTPSSENTLQADYVQPINNTDKLELGVKSIFRNANSFADTDTLNATYDSEFYPDYRRHIDFNYKQNVQAAYALYTTSIGSSLSASVGSRFEYTEFIAKFRTAGTDFDKFYGVLLPSTSVQYKIGQTSNIRAAYARRVSRPSIYYLNPYIDRSIPNNISFGNPTINPEFTDSYELNYFRTSKIVNLNISFSVRHTGNSIERVRLPTDSIGVIATTFANVARNTYYQLSGYSSMKISAKLDLSLSPSLQFVSLRSASLEAEQRGLVASFNGYASYRAPKELVVQLSISGSTPTPQIQGRGPYNFYYTLSSRKTFLDNKLDVSVSLANPFNKYWPYQSSIRTPYFEQNTTYYSYQRIARISVGYRFGKQQQNRSRKQIRNDDIKNALKEDY